MQIISKNVSGFLVTLSLCHHSISPPLLYKYYLISHSFGRTVSFFPKIKTDRNMTLGKYALMIRVTCIPLHVEKGSITSKTRL